MRLIRCHIENFGRLHDLTVEFAPDFHLISEPNGWGKSTLAAFIRVMFFGFEGENRRKGTENERRRYEPWQGGVFGGQITFEAGGRTYTAARVFSDKKANDSFELRDAQTNLKSTDFSEALGEDLFQINGESFARTVFIGQNDCATCTTDRINAKIGNLTDNMNDLDCYEKAAAALKDVQSSLTPRRKTGELSKMNDEITRMQTEVSQNASLEDVIRECTERETQAREELRENRRQLDEVFEISGQVSRIKDRQAKREEYRRLCAACDQAETGCLQAKERFPGAIPSEEVLKSCSDACAEMEQAEWGMQTYALTGEEQDELWKLEAGEYEEDTSGQETAFGEEPVDPEDDGERNEEPDEEPDKEPDEESGEEPDEESGEEPDEELPSEREPRKVWLALFVAGIVLVVVGLIVFLFFNPNMLWLIAATVGVILIAAARMIHRTDLKKSEEENAQLERMRQTLERERAARQEALQRERAARQEALEREQAARREALTREREARLKTLAGKRENYQAARSQYAQKRAFLEDQFRQMGLEPEEPLKAQITAVWRQRIDLQNAQNEVMESRRRKREFEETNDMRSLLSEENAEAENLPSMEELHEMQQQLEAAAEKIRDRADAYGKRLEDLREKYDEWTWTKEHLGELEGDRDRVRKQYDRVGLALECLSTAKEAMTAKYMEPLMTSFSHYYGILTGTGEAEEPADDGARLTAGQYCLDANTNLTVEEYGMQRETDYLSRGYQDMIGLCMRLALVDAMYPDEKPFLLLDDPFVNLDEANRAGGKRLMEDVTRSYQVIYFTCRGS